VATLSTLLRQSSPVVAVRGEGVHLFDAEGRRYLDVTAGIGVTSTGHCHPRVVEAAQRQVGELIHGQYTTVMHPRLLELTEALGERLPPGLDALFYASAGTEAVEAAVRLAKQATGRTNVLVFQGSFHGRTAGALAMTTSKTAIRSGLAPLMGGVFVAPFPHTYRWGWDADTATEFCLRELDEVLATQTAPDETAAMVVEPVQGEGGYVPATTGFLQGLRERCDRHGIVLVVDEIQTGIGRTGRFWGHDHFDVVPDVLVTAKGLASGFPLSAFAASAELMSRGRLGSQGGTYGGNAVSCAAALATLAVVDDEDLVARADARGRHLRAGLRAVAADQPTIGDVRGLGLMVGTELVDGDGRPDGALVARVIAEAAERGLLLLACGAQGQVVRFIPPLVVDEAQVDEAVGIYAESLAKALAAG
jgi:4-aminobutyrate aminotransferase